MQGGTLRNLVEIQQRSTVQDAFGGQSIVWSFLTTVRAAVVPTSGREQFIAQAEQAEVTMQIITRYKPIFANMQAVASMRAFFRGQAYNIHAVVNENSRNRMVTLLCSEGLNDG